MAKFEISDAVLNNIFLFLDRVKYEGLKENRALNEIMSVLTNPIKEENDK
ncbi:hypothetical protein [Paenibacillus naphthalenovorans]|uniref:Uncharacterized protein n=1 Tax=Paenibacillus naphthalenovorans TaxID=162209 RepID=A0A0U2VS30_9BACL|nr:hypothetical protein [Paenibacillus naphthalenovorans]ALS22311.1 hypothetical protein IJ22_19370 [Paenibacillus naphthalenovorans]